MSRRRLSGVGWILSCLPGRAVVIGSAAVVGVPCVGIALLAIAVLATMVRTMDVRGCWVISIAGLSASVTIAIRIFLALKGVPSLVC